MSARVKVCGVTTAADALACVEAGVDAIGLNFVASSPRAISAQEGRVIATAIAGRVLVVGVVADMTVEGMRRLAADVGLGCLQLHGDEPPAAVAALLPHAYKALRVAGPGDVARADDYPGDYLLVDAKVEGRLGGTGSSFDWRLVRELATRRELTLAGGLHPGNVAEAIAAVHPFCVDVASGVEIPGQPRRKDPARVLAFVRAAR